MTGTARGDWLKYVLIAMPTFPASKIKELLPQNWKGSILSHNLQSKPLSYPIFEVP